MTEAGSKIEAGRLAWHGGLAFILVAVCVLGPPMLFSTPAPRRYGLLLGGMIAWLAAGRPAFWNLVPRPWWLAFGSVHAASAIGGLFAGAGILAVAGWSGMGMLGTLAAGAVIWFALAPANRSRTAWLLGGSLAFLLAASLVAYFASIEHHMPLGANAVHFSRLRIALIWPARLLLTDSGQLAWEHTNIAGFFFAIGFVALAGRLARGGGRGWLWVFATLCIAVVFLTGSRSAWLAVAAGSALVLVGRPWRFSVRMALVGLCGVLLGFASLQTKLAIVEAERAAQGPAAKPAVVLQTSGLVTRGSSGRLAGYRLLWDELEGHRWFGRGLGATNKPLPPLMHEHSIYLATLRAGGLVALAGHLILLALSAAAAWRLFRTGTRWPAVILAAVCAGYLFDRVNVFRFTGYHEFLFHWTAVLVPLLLANFRTALRL